MNWLTLKKSDDSTQGVVIYLLVLIVTVQTIYPITIGENLLAYAIYNTLYAMLMVVGVLVTRDSPRLMRVIIVLGVLWLICGLALSVFVGSSNSLTDLGAYYAIAFVLIGVFQIVVMQALVTHIFRSTLVTRDVLFAAIAVYWLLGGFFGSMFGFIEGLTFTLTGNNAFIDGTVGITGEVTPWQTTLYYSYATLTTLGYGDVLPVTGWARSLASVEAVVGVMYTTIIMARLVGIYIADADTTANNKELDHHEN